MIYDIHHNQSVWNPVGTPDCIQGSAFCLRGGVNRHIIGNTIHDVDSGISALRGSQNIFLNNIITEISGIAYGHHIRLDRAPVTNVDYNIISKSTEGMTGHDIKEILTNVVKRVSYKEAKGEIDPEYKIHTSDIISKIKNYKEEKSFNIPN